MNHEPIQASFLYGEFAKFNPDEIDEIGVIPPKKPTL